MVEGISIIGKVWDRMLVEVGRPAPLTGTVFIGVIDRGTNVIQVRPTTLCPLNCIYCSVDAGPRSRWRQAEYVVGDPQWLSSWAGSIARFKGGRVEALIDGVGDPFTYPYLVDLVRLLKAEKGIDRVAVETHGWYFDKRIIDRLDDAGLDRINLSIDTLDPSIARYLTGTSWYNVERVRETAEYIVRETGIDLHVTPVWIPGVNDENVIEVVKWAYRIGAGKKWPPVTIQKYNIHRYGRRVPQARELSWREFWRSLRRIERVTELRVTWRMDEWGMERRPRIPLPYRRGARIRVVIAGPGWLKGSVVGVTLDGKWMVTVRGVPQYFRDREVLVRIREAYDSILIAEPA